VPTIRIPDPARAVAVARAVAIELAISGSGWSPPALEEHATMPTYAYRCLSCGHEFEKFHKMTVRTRPKCPECGTTAERVITGGAGLHFKGSGFYITDYPKKGQKGQERQERQEGQEGPKKSGGDKKAEEKRPPTKKPGDEH
jgi:putative FmdB family regulatory protein